MNITANNVASKLFVAFVAAAMLFTLATPAKAQTAEELQAQINALMAQIAALQSSTGGSSATVAACTFTRALTVGSQGEDVKCLQNALTPKYFTNASGATGYFGPVTQSAVAAWQAANGITPAVGYFGPVSQAKYNAMMTETPADDSDDSDDSTDDSDDSDDSDNGDLSGEASLHNFEVADGEDSDDVEEGSEDVQVAEFTVEFSDGDAMITRIDLALVGTGNTESDPWDVFEEISLWVDGDEVDRMDVTDEDEYLDEDEGTLRFSGLDIRGNEDEEVTIVVAATVSNSVDDAGDSSLADWDVFANSIRFVDADDVTSTETDFEDVDDDNTGASAEFTIDEAGAGDDLDLESSDEDPDATTFELDEDDNVEEAIFAFDLSAEDSDGDVDLNEVKVNVVTLLSGGDASIDELVNDFRLEIDGQSYDVESYVGTGTTTELTFDIDGDSTVSADEAVTAVLFADFENMDDAALEGSTIAASTSAAQIDAEGADDITVDGSAVTGETHTLRTEGVSVDFVDDTVTAIENADASTDDEGRFEIEFTVTSFGDDIYLPFGASSTTDLTSGLEFSILNSNNDVVTTGTYIASFDMDGDDETNSFKVSDGDTETFTLTVTYDPAVSGSYKLRLDDINFATTDAATATDTQDVSDEDVESGTLDITS
jgi:hypothetical protein